MKEIIVEAWTDILIVVMAGDLIYLYFVGAWDEPNTVILVLELIVLFSGFAFGCWRFVRFLCGR